MADPTASGARIPGRETLRVVDADHRATETFESRDGRAIRAMRIEYANEKWIAPPAHAAWMSAA